MLLVPAAIDEDGPCPCPWAIYYYWVADFSSINCYCFNTDDYAVVCY